MSSSSPFYMLAEKGRSSYTLSNFSLHCDSQFPYKFEVWSRKPCLVEKEHHNISSCVNKEFLISHCLLTHRLHHNITILSKITTQQYHSTSSHHSPLGKWWRYYSCYKQRFAKSVAIWYYIANDHQISPRDTAMFRTRHHSVLFSNDFRVSMMTIAW